MFSDPALIKKHRLNLSLNDRQKLMVSLLADHLGMEPAVFIRDVAMERIEELLAQKECEQITVQLEDAMKRGFRN